jgi:hypothetical protein
MIKKVVVRFEVVTMVNMKNNEFWNVTQCSLADKYRLFRETYCLQLHFNAGCLKNRRLITVLTKNPQCVPSNARSIHFICIALFGVCQSYVQIGSGAHRVPVGETDQLI